MKTLTTRTAQVLSMLGLCALMGACANMSNRDRNTAAGAAIGAVTGAVLTGGSSVGTVGGAAVGGVIGNQVGKK
ncbi:MAG TPA: glycine zipper 2TM domain-containing protein [Aquabacterium sp.]|nr:glycine zipper 2TM domain-containing protein [Aquabacterium sp.]HEX5374343.1 glycine zipper 2TM domain-containing protein [Aquabacterium sp.]